MVFFNPGLCGVNIFLGNLGMSDEYCVIVQVITVFQTVFHVSCDAFFDMPPVLLYNGHLAAAHFNTWFQIQQVGSQCSNTGAAPTLYHVIQPINNKACFNAKGKIVQLTLQFIQTCSGFGKLAGFQHHKPLTSGKIAGVNNPHVVKICCCNAGVLVAGGEERTNVYMNYTIIILGIHGKLLLKYGYAASSRGA